jgi:hypothetical protein
MRGGASAERALRHADPEALEQVSKADQAVRSARSDHREAVQAHPDLHVALAADRLRQLLAAAAAERRWLDSRRKRSDYEFLISEKRMTVTMSSAPIGRL